MLRKIGEQYHAVPELSWIERRFPKIVTYPIGLIRFAKSETVIESQLKVNALNPQGLRPLIPVTRPSSKDLSLRIENGTSFLRSFRFLLNRRMKSRFFSLY